MQGRRRFKHAHPITSVNLFSKAVLQRLFNRTPMYNYNSWYSYTQAVLAELCTLVLQVPPHSHAYGRATRPRPSMDAMIASH